MMVIAVVIVLVVIIVVCFALSGCRVVGFRHPEGRRVSCLKVIIGPIALVFFKFTFSGCGIHHY
jgi:hypothetical protein